MLEAISWDDYFTGAAFLLSAYYILIAFTCYRREITHLLKRKERVISAPAAPSPEAGIEELKKVVSDIRAILEGAGREVSKSVLLEQLNKRLTNFAGLRQPAYQVALINYIIKEAKAICGVAFSAEELEKEWETLPR